MTTYTYQGFTTGQRVRITTAGGAVLLRTVGYPGARAIPGRIYVSDGAYSGQHYAPSELELIEEEEA